MARLWRVLTLSALVCVGSLNPSFAADRSGSQSSSSTAVPDYLQRWEFGLDVDEDRGPRFFIDPIAPLYRSSDDSHVVFLEPRLTYRNQEWLMNLGGGYRRLVLDHTWLLGGNMFYDIESEHWHSRVGWGFEAISAYAEARSNLYLPTSGERQIEENAGGTTRARAVPGFDIEVGAPVPYYSRLKIFGGANWYDLPDFKNRYGWTLRTEYKPTSFLVIDGTMSNDTKTNVDWGVTVAFRLPLGGQSEPVHSLLRLDDSMFPESDVRNRVFDLVERHHEIVLQKSITSPAGLVIEAARGGS